MRVGALVLINTCCHMFPKHMSCSSPHSALNKYAFTSEKGKHVPHAIIAVLTKKALKSVKTADTHAS
jgi:hypothetical protein